MQHHGPQSADDTGSPGDSSTERSAFSLRLARATLGLLALAASLQALGSLWCLATGRFLFALGGAEPRLDYLDLPQVLRAQSRDGEVAYLVDLDFWVRLVGYTPAVLTGVVMALGAAWGVAVLGTIGRGRPFDPAVLRGMRRIGFVLSLGGVVAGALDVAANWMLANQLDDLFTHGPYEGLVYDGGSWPVAVIVIGVVVLATGAAFREGARMTEELTHVV
ncbi:DUF2975 domain-containing protein [Serinibacter salmoneus]|uniref:DUF2975 family protein n=1 Tax=Serinibacter salmoneus TaxID=556530 RepID=A0A2A9D1M4_9MICO|nr:DUF2975 domain-containing protein [Serinibacter salmoneus]PFG20155.1 Protein of unknown function (DUF2975) [Serinibacter salmoneus]